ncbi:MULTISPECIES: ATP dependent DNA ligase [unclassified Streptomyces]|uniref:ATP dependent DNA ligase n=1 Tax=unclassified Streptomyces TaxID=2593676 RepID=UPI003561B943
MGPGAGGGGPGLYSRRPGPVPRTPWRPAADACSFAQVPPVAGARWGLPQLVGEVRYTSRTRAGRLRHPSWHRLRPDLAPGGLA